MTRFFVKRDEPVARIYFAAWVTRPTTKSPTTNRAVVGRVTP